MTQKLAASRLTAHYAAIQCFYWMAFSSVFAFAVVFLRSKDFDSAQVGLAMALGYLLAMILQPVVAWWADRLPAIPLNHWTGWITLALLSGALILAILPLPLAGVFICFVWIETLLLVLQPLLNSLAMERINQGQALNFGLARGLGSGSFALFSLLLGAVIIRTGNQLLPSVCAAASLGLMLLAWTFPAARKEPVRSAEIQASLPPSRLPLEPRQWLRQYQGLPSLWMGLMLIMTSLNLFSNYQIHFVERVGGTSQTLGQATALAAILEIPVMGLFSWFVQRSSARRLLRFSTIFFILKALATLLAATVGQYLLSQVFQAGAYAVYLPASVYYFNQIMNPEDRVKGQAVLGMTFSLGGIIGSLLGGFLLDKTTIVITLATNLGLAIAGAWLVFLGSRNKGGIIQGS